jgi:hypothetical protein
MAERTWRATWRLCRALAAAWLGFGVAVPRATAADSTGIVVLEWVAPEGCPDAEYVERETDRLTASATATRGPYLQAHAEVRREPSGLWRVEIRTTGPEGAGLRTITAESCSALADAAALILALAIDPDRVAANRTANGSAPKASATAPSAVATRAATPSNAPSVLAGPLLPSAPVPAQSASGAPAKAPTNTSDPGAEPPRKTGPQSPSRGVIRFAVTASGVLDIGTLPAAAPGFAARLSVLPVASLPLRFELGASQFADESTTQSPARSGTFTLRTFDAGGCAVTRTGHLEVGGCANVEIGWLSAAGLYESVTSRGDAEFMVLRARVTGAYAWSHAWAIRADVGGGFDVTRPEFASTGAEQGLIHQPARYTGRCALGLEVRF